LSQASSAPFPDQAFDYLAKKEYKHWWFRSRNQIIISTLRSKSNEIKNFLEVGCGTGYVISGIARAFPSLQLEASEYFEDGLVFARQRVPSCKFRRLDATQMSEKEAYDCIGCFDVLEHIELDELVLNNFNSALCRGGLLLLTVPQHRWLWSSADEYAHHVRRYTRIELQSKVSGSGLQIEYCTSFVSLLLPLMALQRIFSRKTQYNPDSEFNISSVLNTLLFLIMQIEHLLIRLGLRFPLGGSLLLVARKP